MGRATGPPSPTRSHSPLITHSLDQYFPGASVASVSGDVHGGAALRSLPWKGEADGEARLVRLTAVSAVRNDRADGGGSTGLAGQPPPVASCAWETKDRPSGGDPGTRAQKQISWQRSDGLLCLSPRRDPVPRGWASSRPVSSAAHTDPQALSRQPHSTPPCRSSRWPLSSSFPLPGNVSISTPALCPINPTHCPCFSPDT